MFWKQFVSFLGMILMTIYRADVSAESLNKF